jgi:hypothetical protein
MRKRTKVRKYDKCSKTTFQVPGDTRKERTNHNSKLSNESTLLGLGMWNVFDFQHPFQDALLSPCGLRVLVSTVV